MADGDHCPIAYPWRFHAHRHGLRHVITDGEGRHLASNVPAPCGPLMAAAPELLIALERVVDVAPSGSPAHEVAITAVERFREQEGMALADWRYQSSPPRLRIVGTAS